MPSIEQGLLERLCAEIESAWDERRDYRLVHRLASEHPQLSEYLYDFFDVLSSNDDPDVPAELARRAVDRTRAWLEAGAYTRIVDDARAERRKATSPSPVAMTGEAGVASSDVPARAARGTTPRSLMGFLQRRTGQSPRQIAERIPHATVELLTLIGRYPELVNQSVRKRFAEAVQVIWRIPPQETLAEFERPVLLPRAASRRGAYPPPPGSFAELLQRVGLSKTDQRYWRRAAEEEDEGA